MRAKLVYCPELGQQVEIVETRGTREGSCGALCLDVGRHCTEAICPICTVPPQWIRAELRSLRDLCR